ncbi:MAG: transglycosylase SLT domain-containing protein, partial [Pseudomonadota bacterium]|nr:transglycosylase SLT domain-containing protein [Pseudomonadota bacterium]
MTMRLTQPVAALMIVALLPACVTSPPKQVDNVCHIFREKSGWYGDAKESRARWGVPVSVSMAFMHQESRFVATAKPPRKKLWGVIPGPRPSDAYGYSQAKDSTWEWYQRSTGNYGADRDDFGDAIDFVGWYNNVSHKELGIDKQDAFRLYLAYHEGHGGYRKQSYRSKDWLVDVARKVDRQARR